MMWESACHQASIGTVPVRMLVDKAPLILHADGEDVLINAHDQAGHPILLAINKLACQSLWSSHLIDAADEIEELASTGSWEERGWIMVWRLTFI